jgi:hypothetical protein
MPTFLGVGRRMKERLRALGYTKPNGDLRVQDFALDKRYTVAFFYDWLGDRRTPIRDLERLARDLETTPAWLLFGVAEVVAPAAAPAAPRPPRSTGSARRPAVALAERRARGRRRHPRFPNPLPEVGQRPRGRIMLGSRGPGRVRPAA